nr:hypothetical protein [Bacillus cereus]
MIYARITNSTNNEILMVFVPKREGETHHNSYYLLQPDECFEIPVVYIGRDYGLPARAVIYRLTPEQETQRRKDRAYKEKKKRITFSDRIKKLQGMNVYVTNIPSEYVSKEATMNSTPFVGKSACPDKDTLSSW